MTHYVEGKKIIMFAQTVKAAANANEDWPVPRVTEGSHFVCVKFNVLPVLV